ERSRCSRSKVAFSHTKFHWRTAFSPHPYFTNRDSVQIHSAGFPVQEWGTATYVYLYYTKHCSVYSIVLSPQCRVQSSPRRPCPFSTIGTTDGSQKPIRPVVRGQRLRG